jgi:hypothetical protein
MIPQMRENQTKQTLKYQFLHQPRQRHQENGNFLLMSFRSFFSFQKLRKEIEKLGAPGAMFLSSSFCSFQVPFVAFDSFQKVI